MVYNRQVGAEAALDRATALAKQNEARLTVVEVVEKGFVAVMCSRYQRLFNRLMRSTNKTPGSA